MKVNVNVIVDFSFGFLSHGVLLPPPIVPPAVPTFSVEMIATFMWTLGFAMNQNKFSNGAKPVTHKGMWIALDGHDCGMMIPDITVPPAPNIWYPMMWPFSSRKPIMAASTVKINTTAVACAQWIGLPPIPMMSCGEPVSVPVCWSAISVTNTVQVGMTFTDMLVGLITTVASVATDLLFSKLPGNTFGQVAFANALKGLSPVSALAGFGTSALTGNATLSGSIGLPFANISVSYTPNPDAGSPSVVFGGALPFFRGDSTGAGQVSGIPVTL